MPITTETEGFFTTSGVLRSNTQNTAPATPEPAPIESDPAKEAARATASAITEAAVVTIGQRMNVGSTGFDKGVSEIVLKAVTAALDKQSDTSSSVVLRPVGGRFQNEIMYGKPAEQPESPAPPEVTTPTPAPEKVKTKAPKNRSGGGSKRFGAFA